MTAAPALGGGLFGDGGLPPGGRRLHDNGLRQQGWPFGALPPKSYGLIYIDPPWEQEFFGAETGVEKAPQKHYACMSLDAIKALPVGQLAGPDCFIVMWSLWNFVGPGVAGDVLRAWGFEPKSGGGWFKLTANDKAAFGTGYGFRGCCEPFLTGSIGAPKVVSKSERNGFTTYIDAPEGMAFNALLAKLRQHSRKPDEMRAVLERMFPHVRRAELFAREKSHGWDVWGNETEKFSVEAAR
jgi:N6-adenosine-specific RNA methylase IME4